MITELRVRDLATIADVTLQLGPGLNVLTGETGAGKSMLVDALALLLGERAASGSVRPGAAKLIVEGAFEGVDPAARRRIEDLGLDLDDDGRLIIRREVSAEGRSRAWVNGSPTTATVLAELGALLVDLHGQHETQSLLHAEAQREILDAFAHAEAERAAVAESHAALHRLRAEETTLAAKPRRSAPPRRLPAPCGERDRRRQASSRERTRRCRWRRAGSARRGRWSSTRSRIADALEGDEGNALGAVTAADRALGGAGEGRPVGRGLAGDARCRLRQPLGAGAARGGVCGGGAGGSRAASRRSSGAGISSSG